MLIAGLINHPEFGLILFETGSAEDVQRVDALGTPFAIHFTDNGSISNGAQTQWTYSRGLDTKNAIAYRLPLRPPGTISKM